VTESVPLTWEEVARVYGRKIYNLAYRLTGNSDDASDLVQEVLLRVRKGLASYQPGSFEGWLWRITRNAFLDDVRRRNRRPTAPLPDEVDRWDLASAPSADTEYARISIGDDVQKALLELPVEFREAVVLCDVVGLSYEEIAQAVAVPVGTVRSRIHRGRKLLRELLT
jgi:RNA polymerase sigma-70 factor (ECF subfamily)